MSSRPCSKYINNNNNYNNYNKNTACKCQSKAMVFLTLWKFFKLNIILMVICPCGKLFPLNPFPNKPWFLYFCCTSLKNTVKNGEIAHKEYFLLLPQCFLPIWRTFFRCHQIWNRCLQTLWIWKGLRFVIIRRLGSGLEWKSRSCVNLSQTSPGFYVSAV